MRYVLVRAISNTIFTHVTRGRWVSAALQDPPPPGTHCRWAQRRMTHSLGTRCHWAQCRITQSRCCWFAQSLVACCHWVSSVLQMPPSATQGWHRIAHSLVTRWRWVASQSTLTHDQHRFAHSLITPCRWAQRRTLTRHTFSLGRIAFYTSLVLLPSCSGGTIKHRDTDAAFAIIVKRWIAMTATRPPQAQASTPGWSPHSWPPAFVFKI